MLQLPTLIIVIVASCRPKAVGVEVVRAKAAEARAGALVHLTMRASARAA